MAITLQTSARNAACDAIVDLVDGSSGDTGGDFEFLDNPTTIVICECADPAFGAAATGAAALASTPRTGTATAAGAAVDLFNVRDKGNNDLFSGSVTATSGGGDIEFDNTNVANGQDVNLNSFTLTVPAS